MTKRHDFSHDQARVPCGSGTRARNSATSLHKGEHPARDSRGLRVGPSARWAPPIRTTDRLHDGRAIDLATGQGAAPEPVVSVPGKAIEGGHWGRSPGCGSAATRWPWRRHRRRLPDPGRIVGRTSCRTECLPFHRSTHVPASKGAFGGSAWLTRSASSRRRAGRARQDRRRAQYSLLIASLATCSRSHRAFFASWPAISAAGWTRSSPGHGRFLAFRCWSSRWRWRVIPSTGSACRQYAADRRPDLRHRVLQLAVHGPDHPRPDLSLRARVRRRARSLGARGPTSCSASCCRTVAPILVTRRC